jgi:hypothetical protein
LQQKLGQIGPVLAGNAKNERFFTNPHGVNL